MHCRYAPLWKCYIESDECFWHGEQIISMWGVPVIPFQHCSCFITSLRHWDISSRTYRWDGIRADLNNKWRELVWCFQELFCGKFCPTSMLQQYNNWTQNNICMSFIREVNSTHTTDPVLPKTPQRIHKQDNKRDITGHMELFCPQYSLWQTEHHADKFSPYDEWHYV